MFGSEKGTKAEIWDDDFACCVFAGKDFERGLALFSKIAAELNCMISIHGSGEVIKAKPDGLLDEFKASIAFKFTHDPEVALVEAGKNSRANNRHYSSRSRGCELLYP